MTFIIDKLSLQHFFFFLQNSRFTNYFRRKGAICVFHRMIETWFAENLAIFTNKNKNKSSALLRVEKRLEKRYFLRAIERYVLS